jgi:hypothetical protein
LADETTDISGEEDMAKAIRYVYVYNLKICENFKSKLSRYSGKVKNKIISQF